MEDTQTAGTKKVKDPTLGSLMSRKVIAFRPKLREQKRLKIQLWGRLSHFDFLHNIFIFIFYFYFNLFSFCLICVFVSYRVQRVRLAGAVIRLAKRVGCLLPQVAACDLGSLQALDTSKKRKSKVLVLTAGMVVPKHSSDASESAGPDRRDGCPQALI